MRVEIAALGLLVVGCAGPHSSGGLWAQQNLERELALFRLSDAQRSAQARAFELAVADEALAAERTRIEARLQDCPGALREQLSLSTADATRDGIRIRVQDDGERMAAV